MLTRFDNIGTSSKLKPFVSHDNYYHLKPVTSSGQKVDDYLWGNIADKTRLIYAVVKRMKLDYVKQV
jgi:hypothetical protein